MRVYFGDNQFLGVNHSDGKGGSYLKKYQSADDIAETLRAAWDTGIRDFCFTVNAKTIDAVNIVVDDCPFKLHPALPYAHRVNEMILDNGLTGALSQKIRQSGFWGIPIAGIKAIFGRYEELCALMIHTELAGIPMRNVSSIGLLNVAGDFLLGLDRIDIIHLFYDVVRNRFGKNPLYYTMNFPLMSDALWGKGYRDCSIVFNYNEAGFRTNPSLSDVRNNIDKYYDHDNIAMSLFSGGETRNINKLLDDVPALNGVLFGSSRKSNIQQNFDILDSRH
jgi:hypothetical protein